MTDNQNGGFNGSPGAGIGRDAAANMAVCGAWCSSERREDYLRDDHSERVGECGRLRVLVGCEYSGVVRRAFRKRGHDAWSCDLLPSEDSSPHHIQGDVVSILGDGWDLAIFHPPCTRLTNSGVRWLKVPPPGRSLESMWQELEQGASFYIALRNAPIPRIALENPIMHLYARARIQPRPRQVVQPWWFGEPYFKATGFELIGLPPLVPTNRLTPPARGTDEHKAWSKVHRASPGPDRWKERSRTFPGIADAMAAQWGALPMDAAA